MKIFDIKWQANTAGPTPPRYNNYRTELFLFGCNRAKEGRPCKGCFNSMIWDDSIVQKTYSAHEVADKIIKYAPNKYVTIGGGEPTDQFEELIELSRILHDNGFHIMVYTWKNLMQLSNSESPDSVHFHNLMKYVDMIVDGEYDYTKRLYNENKNDGLLNSIGSGNQTVWYKTSCSDHIIFTGYKMDNIKSLSYDENNFLVVDAINPKDHHFIIWSQDEDTVYN